MRRPFVVLVLLAMIAAPLASPPAGATQDLPLAYHLRLEGDGWFAVNVSAVGEARITLEMDGRGNASVSQLMILSDRYPGPASRTLGRSDSSIWAYVQASPETPGVRVPAPPGDWRGGTFPGNVADASTVQTIVVWGAGVEWIGVQIHSADAAFSAAEVARGDRAWIWDGAHFDSDEPMLMANVGAYHVAHVENATRTFDVRGRFAGLIGFDAWPEEEWDWEERLRLEDPDGRMLECFCQFALARDESFSLPPGRYVLHRDAHGIVHGPALVFAGADIELPW